MNKHGSLLYELQQEGEAQRWRMVSRWAAVHPPDPLPEELMFLCLESVSALAERVAHCSRFDFLRVDILIRDGCKELLVSEASAWPGTPYPPEQREDLERRWRYGYGIDTTG